MSEHHDSDDRGGKSTLKGLGSGNLLEGLPFNVGSTIAGKYRVDRILGAGGMGVILAGHHVALDQRVAIKVLKPNAIGNVEFVTRFGREARAAARLRSEHVARVLDVGESDGLPYMVMEYLSGRDLSRVVRDEGPLAVADAAAYVMQACEGLAEAHRAGIVHRDLKPANLFLTKATDGTPLVKVLDFGISKVLNRPEDTGPSEGLTQTQAMIGSPHYMSPEQLKSARDVDARTDIWSLGGVLFKLLTNEPAFAGDSTPELCVAILVGSPRELRQYRPDVPEALEKVILKCLMKDPAARYGSVGELAGALAAFAPPSSAASVDRIVRVAASSDPRHGQSDPPQAMARSGPSSGDIPAASRADDALASGGTVDVPLHFEMTTLTSSASSLSAGGASGSTSQLIVPKKRLGLPLAIGGLVVVAALVGGVTLAAMQRGNRSAATGGGAGLVAPAPTMLPPAAADQSPIVAVAPSAAHPAAAASAAHAAHAAHALPATSATTRATATTPARAGLPAQPAQRGAAPPSARPIATAVAPSPPTPPPPPPPAPTAGTSDFGGRK